MLLATREQSFIRLVNSVPGAFLYKDILFFLLTAYVLTELYIKKEANTSKKESQISLELFLRCVRDS